MRTRYAGVTIDSGPVDASDGLGDVPQDKWPDLMRARRTFLRIHLPYDCRQLLQFVDDAEEMYGPLGFASPQDFIKRGLELDPQEVDWAIAGLRRRKPDEPIPFQNAIKLGKHGGDRKSAAFQKSDAIGRGVDYLKARLERDYPDIAAALERGEYTSVRQAAIAAGIVRRRADDPLEALHRAWGKASAEQRAAFLEAVAPAPAPPDRPVRSSDLANRIGAVMDAVGEPGLLSMPRQSQPVRPHAHVMINSGSPPVWKEPPPLGDGPQVRVGGEAVVVRYSAVSGVYEDKVRKFRVSEVRPYAQYERAVHLSYVYPRDRTSTAFMVCPDNVAFYLIRVGDQVVYDSRRDVPCDMAKWSASRRDMAARDRQSGEPWTGAPPS